MSVRNIILNAAAPGFDFGANWTNRRALSVIEDAWPITNGQVLGVAYGSSKYVVFGRTGSKVAVSSDLSSFDHVDFTENVSAGTASFVNTFSSSSFIVDCIYAGGKFVGVINNSNVPFWYSSNGTDWYLADDDGTTYISRAFNIAANRRVPKIAHNGSIFLSVGNSGGASDGICMTSATGTTWAEQPGYPAVVGTKSSPYGVVWTGVRFVVALQSDSFVLGEPTLIVTSTNGVTWSSSPVGTMTNVQSLAYFNSYVIALGRDSGGSFYTYYSLDDGLTWTRSASTSASSVSKITTTPLAMYSGISSLSASGPGYYRTTSVTFGTLIRRVDPDSFEEYPYSLLNTPVESMSYVNSKLLAGSETGDLYEIPDSSDNPNSITNKYTNMNLLGTRFTAQYTNKAAAANSTHIIFAGGYGRIARMALENLSSPSARADLVSATLNAAANWGTVGDINTSVWDGTRFIVAGADGKVATSTDGATWTYQAGLRSSAWGTTDDVLCSVVVSGTTYLFGTNGKLASSSDGATWTPSTGLSSTAWGTTQVNGAAHSGSLFVVVGDDGKVATSSDGTTWTNQTGLSSTSWSTTDANAVAWSGDESLFVVVGDTGKIATSPDGVTWTVRTSGTTQNLTGVAWGVDRFAVVGRGTALTSANGITWSNNSSGLTNIEDWTSTITPNAVFWIDNRFIICGPSGRLATSP